MKTSPKQPSLAECDPKDHASRPSAHSPIGEDAYERAAGFFRALGDVSRLRLLARLADGEWCVTELAQASGAALATVSQQLRLLRSEGLVTRRRVAKHVYYALADAHISKLIASAFEHAAEDRPPPNDD